MAQVSTSGAAATLAASARKEALASMFTQEEARAIKDKIMTDGGREFASMLARDAFERPKIPISDGKLVPADFDSLFRIATWIESLKLYGVKEKGGGTRLYTVPEIAAIIAAGLRVGMDPFYALETIALINGKTCIFGRGVRGVVMASGKCTDWQEERIGFTDDGLPTEGARVVVTLKRKDFATPFVGSFSVAQAKAAGLWGGSDYSPWKKYPGDMLTWKAVGRASLGFSDVLGGMSVAEEVADIEHPPERPSAVSSLNTKLEEAAKEPSNPSAPGREVQIPSAPATTRRDRGNKQNPADAMGLAPEATGPGRSVPADDDLNFDDDKKGGAK